MSFFQLITIITKFSVLWHTAAIHLLFLMHNIPFRDCSKMYLSIYYYFLIIDLLYVFKGFMMHQRFLGGGSQVVQWWRICLSMQPLRQDDPLGLVQPLSRVWLFVTPWTAAPRVSLSITNSRSSDPRSSNWHPTPVLLPGESHGWRSLAG